MTPSADSDEALVELAQQGNRAAFDQLVKRYQGAIMRLVSRIIRNSPDAEDIVQETFIRAFRALGSFHGNSMFSTWLYRIAINVTRTYWRTVGKNPLTHASDYTETAGVIEAPETLIENNTPESILAGKQVEESLNLAIDELPLNLKTVLVLREIEGLSYQEISNIVECPIGTVRSRIFRAREIVAQRLSEK